MSLMCPNHSCKLEKGMCKHEKMMLGLIIIVVVVVIIVKVL